MAAPVPRIRISHRARGLAGAAVLLALALPWLGSCREPAPGPVPAPPRLDPTALHREAFVFDAHVDTLERLAYEDVDLTLRQPSGDLDLPRLARGGADGLLWSIAIDPAFTGAEATAFAMRQVERFHDLVRQHAGRLAFASDRASVERASREGKVAALLGIEGGQAIGGEPLLLRAFHKLGVRAMSLTGIGANDLADSADTPPVHGGLTSTGREVIHAMNEIGMLLDLSHASDAVFQEALTLTTKPVIVSHASCRALCPDPRNLTDEQLRALAENGGVIGICFASEKIDPTFAARRGVRTPAGRDELLDRVESSSAEARAWFRYHQRMKPPGVDPAPFARLIDHIDHAVRVAGIEHVGLGSDFDGTASVAGDLDVSAYPRITEELVRRGYSAAAIRGILGENFLRVLGEVTGA